jgi:hypothetical protein
MHPVINTGCSHTALPSFCRKGTRAIFDATQEVQMWLGKRNLLLAKAYQPRLHFSPKINEAARCTNGLHLYAL